MADLIREALRAHLTDRQVGAPRGAGAFDSGHTDTTERHEELLEALGFGAEAPEKKDG